ILILGRRLLRRRFGGRWISRRWIGGRWISRRWIGGRRLAGRRVGGWGGLGSVGGACGVGHGAGGRLKRGRGPGGTVPGRRGDRQGVRFALGPGLLRTRPARDLLDQVEALAMPDAVVDGGLAAVLVTGRVVDVVDGRIAPGRAAALVSQQDEAADLPA